MSKKILEQVKSPFTDEFIQKLIETYTSCGCDDNLFYQGINNLETNSIEDNSFTNELTKHIFKNGISEFDFNADETSSQYIYRDNNTWITISSEKDPMKERETSFDDKKPLLYRVYLNIKGKDKSDFILNYINSCRENNLPFKFKYSRDDSRNDQVVLLSTLENLEQNISIIEQLTQNMQLNNLPMLIGSYREGIGIAEEYFNKLYSPTKAKLALVRTSVKKYICDHRDEFYEDLSDDEKKKIDKYMHSFRLSYDIETEDKECMGEKYEDLRKRYYQNKSSIDCAKEHIENDKDAYVCGDGLLELGSAISRIYQNNPEQFITEVTENFRMIGTQVWGFAQNFVFSNETEKRIIPENPVSKKEIDIEQEN